MSERRFTILSTASLPFERVSEIPESVDIQVLPFIKIRPRDSLELIPFISEQAAHKKNVVFTSAHAVKIVCDCLKRVPDWKIFCIRHETRASVEKFFGAGRIGRYAENALLLSGQMIEDAIRDAVFFCGDQRLDILPENLRRHGVTLEEFIVYETRLTPVGLSEIPDVILFFSPTAVESFFSMNELSPLTAVFVMGKTTANSLKKFTDHPVSISPVSDKAFVLKMAMDFAHSHPIIRP
jgi:uroporphyrinogen-III synthase